jgi:small subunit ribosomal protein S6
MNHYETLFIVKPTLTEEEIKAQIARVKEAIGENGGEIVAASDMGMRKLAYPIEKQERGYYTVVYFKAPGSTIDELERQMKYNEEILRFMTVKYSNKKEIAQFDKMVAAASKEDSSASAVEESPETTEEA